MIDCRGEVVTRFTLEPLDGASFGARLRFVEGANLGACVKALEAEPELLSTVLGEAGGLLVMTGMQDVSRDPRLMVRLSQLLGPEVEDYR